jgi:hypothetical protein
MTPGADDGVETVVEALVFELGERRQAQVARAAPARDRVFARIQAEVMRMRPQRVQRRLPGTFAAADVEYVADRPA